MAANTQKAATTPNTVGHVDGLANANHASTAYSAM